MATPFRLPKNDQREMLKLLIRFAWGSSTEKDRLRAQRIIVGALGLCDEQPLDAERRKSDLDEFLNS